jgi:hypothetical protein
MCLLHQHYCVAGRMAFSGFLMDGERLTCGYAAIFMNQSLIHESVADTPLELWIFHSAMVLLALKAVCNGSFPFCKACALIAVSC